MNLLNGMISFMLMTFLRYVVARFSGIFLIAWAASRVFYIGTFMLGKPTARGLRGLRETRLTRKMNEGCGPREREPPNSRKVKHFLLFSEVDFLSGDTEGSRLG